jgi:predicted ATPase/DNA-binding XRE family transcriptional regulator
MKRGAPGSFGAHLKALREAAGFTQEELASIAGLSVQAISALERGERRRPHLETVRALSAALNLTGEARDSLVTRARAPAHDAAVDELSTASLPLPLTHLVGRDRDVALLRQWIADPAARLITLIGPGGVGKTRLGLEVARRVAEDDAAAAVVFVELGSIRQATFVAPAIAEALGLSDIAAADLPRHVQSVCSQQRPMLLVLDNCEQVPDAAPLVADLVTSARSLRVLATSRAALRIRGERLYSVEPLDLRPDSDGLPPVELAGVPAVRLFIERAREVRPDFRLTSANAPAVVEICRRLDALPLALELAAPWLKVLTPEDLLNRLQPHAVLPDVGARDLPERQQTMNATVAWSYRLLDTEEQRAFRRFGVLPGLFSIDAAAAVLAGRDTPTDDEDALRAAAGLIDKSLLVPQTSAVATCQVYQMLETVRTYAVLELARSDEREEAYEGLAGYCTREASRAASGLVGPAQVEWLHRVREDLDSYRAALAWLIERGRATEASHIAWSLLFFWMIRGHGAEGLRWYEEILSIPHVSPSIESQARAGAAVMCYPLGNLERARAEGMRARELAAATGGADVVPVVDLALGHVEQFTGNILAARERFSASIPSFEQLKSPWGAGNALSAIAWLALGAGDDAEAQRLASEADVALRGAGPWFRALGLYVRAVVAIRRGNADEAIALVREGVVLIRHLQDKFAFMYVMLPLAAAAILKRDDAWAGRILGARDAVAERTGLVVVDAAAHQLLGMVQQEGLARLGADRWSQAYAWGRTASIDSLLNDIEAATT